ncbi:MAG: tRNA 4-thiouridine(8) synthase ThiI [Myxococcales bacterium]|nr:tRNA 4-thiouridine(8) synthase ThiI [Myxococcales bacterium]
MTRVVDLNSTLILARMGELFLKGQNQSWFVKKLRSNLKANLLIAVGACTITEARGQLFIRLESNEQLRAALDVCANTPGLMSCSPVIRVETDPDLIRETATRLAVATWQGQQITFSVKSKRADKRYKMTSPEMNRYVADGILDELDLKVDLKAPQVVMNISYKRDLAHIWTESIEGVGGMPIGATGKVMLLLSGGIDSPVAGFLAQKRGCRLNGIYFHSPPFISEASREKVEELARRLAVRQNGMRLHVVSFTNIQKAIRDACDPKLTVLLYRRFMYRIAAQVAKQADCYALCTGESLAQVASQTLENLHMVDSATDMLTLRPLLAYDKAEIVKLARQIDTLETSTLPYDDCCSLFVPKHPVTRGRHSVIDTAESRLDVDALVNEALLAIDIVDL